MFYDNSVPSYKSFVCMTRLNILMNKYIKIPKSTILSKMQNHCNWPIGPRLLCYPQGSYLAIESHTEQARVLRPVKCN